MNRVKHTKVMSALGLVAALSCTSAMADSSRELHASYPYEGQKLVLDVGVGETVVIASDEQAIRVEVKVESEKSGWFSWHETDIDGITLEADNRSGKLVLSLSEQDDVKQTWRVYVPKETAVDIDLGVGEINVEGLASNLTIDVGVGSVQVKHNHTYQDIDLDAGVGEVALYENGQMLDAKRTLVSQSYRAHHAGNGALNVSVGVGEVTIHQTN